VELDKQNIDNIFNVDIPNGIDIANGCKSYILTDEILELVNRPQWVMNDIAYNVFRLPNSSCIELYHWIRNWFWANVELIKVDGSLPYFIQGWVNVFSPGESIHWHTHCSNYYPNMYHGVFCVESAGESYTLYGKSVGDSDHKVLSKIPSINGECHIITDMTTPHKSTENLSDEPRITIAFDIVDLNYFKHVYDNPTGNQYIPLV
jgi:hypothetical protein